MSPRSKPLSLLLVAILEIVGGQQVALSQSENFEVLGSIGGYLTGAEIHGDYAYIAEDFTLSIVDLTTPGDLEPVVRLPSADSGSHIRFNGSKAYLSIGTQGIQVVDITNPPNATLLDRIPSPDGRAMVTENGQIGYSVNGYYLDVYDISDPQTPTYIRSVQTGTLAGSFIVDGNRAISTDVTYFRILDLSNPANPTVASTYSSGLSSGQFAVYGNMVFYRSTYPNGLYFVDISDPVHPVAVGTYSGFSSGYKVVDYQPPYVIFSTGTDSSIRVLDISNPASPVIVGSFPPAKSRETKSLSSTLFFSGPYLFDIDEPTAPSLVGTFDRLSLNVAHSVQIDYPVLFAGDGNRGITAFNVSNAAYPVEIWNATLSYFGVDLDFKPPYLFAAMRDASLDAGGLQIFDLSNVQSPVRLGSVSFTQYANKVAVSGTVALCAVYSQGIKIVDVSDPHNPTIIHSLDTFPLDSPFPIDVPFEARDIRINGSLAYITTGTSLKIVDISDPTLPSVIGSLSLDGAYGLDIGGGCAVIAGGDKRKLHVIDVSDPTMPTLVQSIQTLISRPYNVFVKKNLVYVGGQYGLEVYSWVNHTLSGPIGYLKKDYIVPEEIKEDSGRIYVAAGNDGLLIGQLFQPQDAWIDFPYVGEENGTFDHPYNSLAEGVTWVSSGGTLKVKAGTTGETPRIDKKMRIEAFGGTVRIGDLAAKVNQEDEVPVEEEDQTIAPAQVIGDRFDSPELLNLLGEMRQEKIQKRNLFAPARFWMREIRR